MKYSVFRYFSSIIKFFSYSIIVVLTSCSKEEDPTPDMKFEMQEYIDGLRAAGCKCGSTDMPPVPSVKWNAFLEIAALEHATDMHERNYLDHLSPEGITPAQRAIEAGYEGKDIGENIARGYWSVKDVIKGWQNSEPHCKAMMSELYSEIGAASYESYWVLSLGNPY